MRILGDNYYTSKELEALGIRSVGHNVRVHKRASVYGLENVVLGDNVRIDDFCVIVATGVFEVGSFVHIPPFCFFGAKYGIFIGDFTSFAHGVRVYSSADDYSGDKLTGCMVSHSLTGGGGRVNIGRHCIIGANSVILPNVVLEDGVAVGALSLVKNNLEGFYIYGGVPAKKLKVRSQKLLELEKEISTSL